MRLTHLLAAPLAGTALLALSLAPGQAHDLWLTPAPGGVPADGSTIDVIVDGQSVGHPVYGIFRADIAGLFPGYVNTNSAVGYYVLDTTTLTNGLHTIAWVVRDDQGRAEGIGSRYFRVFNP